MQLPGDNSSLVRALRQDVTTTDNSQELLALMHLLVSGPELGKRVALPRPKVNELAQHRLQSMDRGAGMQWISFRGETPELRYVKQNDDGSMQVLRSLSDIGETKLAKNDRQDLSRSQLAGDLFRLSKAFYPNMIPEERSKRAGGKYEYINARGNEAHHIMPIKYLGKVMDKLKQLGIDGPILDEMVLRHMSLGDTTGNLASVETKATPGREFLERQDKSNTVDQHDRAHRISEGILKLSGLPQQNAGQYRLDNFMDDPNKTNLQKQAYGMAIAQAHRLGLQGAQLGAPNTQSRNGHKERYMDGRATMLGEVIKAKEEFSPFTQQILSDMYGKTPETIDVQQSLRTYAKRR